MREILFGQLERLEIVDMLRGQPQLLGKLMKNKTMKTDMKIHLTKNEILEKFDLPKSAHLIIDDTTVEPENKEIIFEDLNFRIDSSGWKKCKEYLENPEGDVWEILKGDYKGEQLFTWKAAMRETKKAGKKMPTRDDFVKVFADIIPDWPKAGYRYRTDGSLDGQGSSGNYWSSNPNGTYAYYLYFYSTSVYPADNGNRAVGFSVRCIKN